MTVAVLAGFAAAAAPAGPLEASPVSVALWTIVTFLLLFGLLYKLAWPKLINALEERENSIRRALEEADRNRQEAATLVEEHRRALDQVKEEARSILEEERVNGEKLRQEIVTRARAEATQIVDKAKQEIDFERDRAVEALRREAVELSLQAAEKVLGRAVTDDDHRRLVEEAVGELGKLKV